MTSFKISDGSKLTGNPIQTIITDLPPQDDKLDDEIFLYTPESSPTQEDMTQSNEHTEMPENRLDLLQYPDVAIIDEGLQHDERLGNEFSAMLDVESDYEEIEATRSPSDAEIREQTESSQTVCRHVSQIAQEKEDDETWQAFINYPDQQQFAPQNVRISYSSDILPSVQLSGAVQAVYNMQTLVKSMELEFSSEVVYDTQVDPNCPKSERFVFVNTAEAKRENQRASRFGIRVESDAMDQIPFPDLRLAVWASVPGEYRGLKTCNTHRNKIYERFQHDDFMRVSFMNNPVDETIPAGTIPGLSNHPELWVMPVPKSGDCDAIELTFFCYSSCLKKGNAKENLRLEVALLDRQNEVVRHVKQPIRITANTHRDAGHWPGSTKPAGPSKPRKQSVKRRVPMKALPRSDSDEDYRPGNSIKRIKREPHPSPPPYNALALVHDAPMSSVTDPNHGFNTIVDAMPLQHQDEVRRGLLRMHSDERKNFIEAEQERMASNLLISLKQHQKRP